MLCKDKVIALYCIIDDLLKAIGHREDCRTKVSDAEVITTAFAAMLYFGGHYDNARAFMKMTGLVPRMLDKSRFSRRLHRRAELLQCLFSQFAQYIKDLAGRPLMCWILFRLRSVITFASPKASFLKASSTGAIRRRCAGTFMESRCR